MKAILMCITSLAAGLASPALAHEVTDEMTHAAQHFVATLTPEQRSQALIPFADAERANWHFVPRSRRGISFKAMKPEQRLLAFALLSTGLSQRGYGKALSVMSLETILAEVEQGRGPVRDPELFYLSIFGEPGDKEPWGWRVEGHHISFNFASVANRLPAVTPSFLGSNPAEVRQGPRAGMRVLAAEEDVARRLVQSLDETQRKAAIIAAQAPADILNVPGRSNYTKVQGIKQSQLAPAQSTLLVQLIREYLNLYRPQIADAEWKKIEADGLSNIHFAWAGGMERGQGHYYRVQGKRFVLEYDNTQDGANHIHTVWRDLENDFGADLLKEHYEQSHPQPSHPR
jgi:hypothetical protein